MSFSVNSDRSWYPGYALKLLSLPEDEVKSVELPNKAVSDCYGVALGRGGLDLQNICPAPPPEIVQNIFFFILVLKVGSACVGT